MSESAIIVENLSKAYRIGARHRRHETLVGAAMAVIRSPWSNLVNLRKLRRFDSDGEKDIVWALRGVSLRIKPGEVVGVIGRNGAGKSTFLKILSRITEPTRGRVGIFGRVGSLLEVGTGFHPELTGRENVYLNGTILGMRRHEVEAKFDEIVEFSGVEKFIDTPVKRYSSGMRVRLAFSVAAHLEPEILLVDEVLAVGDAAFQQKCLGRMNEVAKLGRTVLFVSHNMGAVTNLCQRGVWIDRGTLVADGPVEDVVESYLRSLADHTFDFSNADHGFSITNVVVKNARGEQVTTIPPGEDLIVEISFQADKRMERPKFWVKVQSLKGPCFAANMELDGSGPESIHGSGTLVCRFKSLPLLPNHYTLVMGVRNGRDDVVMSGREVASFTVSADLAKFGFHGDILDAPSRATPVVIPYEWTMPDGRVVSISLAKDSSGLGGGMGK